LFYIQLPQHSSIKRAAVADPSQHSVSASFETFRPETSSVSLSLLHSELSAASETPVQPASAAAWVTSVQSEAAAVSATDEQSSPFTSAVITLEEEEEQQSSEDAVDIKTSVSSQPDDFSALTMLVPDVCAITNKASATSKTALESEIKILFFISNSFG
jgi:hypothetical protein